MKNFIKYKDWYKLTNKKLKKKYKHNYKLVASLIASTSPRFSVKRNIITALRIYDAFMLDYGGHGVTFLHEFKTKKEKYLKTFKILNAHYNNIIKSLEAFQNNNLESLELGGLKVDSFYHNLIGDYSRVTIDIWMLRYFNHTKAWVNKSEYLKYSKIIEAIAEKEGLKNAEVQAVIWTKIRREHGFKPVNFSKFI